MQSMVHVVLGELGDETEDLYNLSEHVKVRFNLHYQHVRVEHVCVLATYHQGHNIYAQHVSLSLTYTLSLLIKVAGIGLIVKHLGKTLNEMQDTLHATEQSLWLAYLW
ncbi:hypothetical protein BDR04DRAFT_1088250 [Suillus decipiens]|nr:hypothetical protein BDR04DRAFT_1088250 [Suillus decipiens]